MFCTVQIDKFHFPLRRDDERLAGGKLLDSFGWDVEGGLNRRPLARDNDDAFVDIVEPGPYAAGIARRERPAVARRGSSAAGSSATGPAVSVSTVQLVSRPFSLHSMNQLHAPPINHAERVEHVDV